MKTFYRHEVKYKIKYCEFYTNNFKQNLYNKTVVIIQIAFVVFQSLNAN